MSEHTHPAAHELASLLEHYPRNELQGFLNQSEAALRSVAARRVAAPEGSTPQQVVELHAAAVREVQSLMASVRELLRQRSAAQAKPRARRNIRPGAAEPRSTP